MAKLTNEKIISALLATTKIKDAAILCGVSESTLYARMRKPQFKELYGQVRRNLIDQGTAALQGHLNSAIQTIADIQEDETVPPQVRLNAAEAIIRNTLKLTEQNDILARLDALEESNT